MNAAPAASGPVVDIGHLPPLHCLLAFEAAGRHRSLAKAAGELRRSASALTQSIALLEDRLALKLVRSLVPVVELTAPGAHYLRAVQAFQTRLRDGLYERSPHGRTQLRVTAPQALSRLWLAPRLAGFVQRHPRIDLLLTATERFERIAGGGVDVALRSGAADDEGLVARPLWTDRLVAVASPALAARADGLAPATLASTLPLIDHPVSGWQRWLTGIELHGRTAAAMFVCTDLHLAIEAAVHGIGVAIAPARLVRARIDARALHIVSTHTVAAEPYRVVVSPEQQVRAAVRAFLLWLDEMARG